MEDERLVVRDRQQLGQVRLRSPDVDIRVAVVAEDPKAPIEMEIDRAGLEVTRVVRPDRNLAGLDGRPDVPVGKDTHRCGFPVPGRRPRATGEPRSSKSLSTSRLRASS